MNATYSSSVAHQHTALLTLSDRSRPMPPMEADAAYQGCLSASYTVDHSLSSVQARVRSWDCAHVVYAISRLRTRVTYAIQRLPAQSRDSEDAQRNLKIAQIPRLRRTYIWIDR